MMRGARASFGCLVFALVLASGSARAEGDPARDEFDRGVRQYNEEHYREADAAFAHAFELSPQPAYLFSRARAQQRMAAGATAADERIKHFRDAIANLRKYIAMTGGTRIKEAVTLIEKLEGDVKEIQDLAADDLSIGVILIPDTASLWVNGAPQADHSSVKVKRGECRFRAVADGYEVKEVTRDCQKKIDFVQLRLTPIPIYLTVRGKPGAEVWIGPNYMATIAKSGVARVPVEPGMANVFVRKRGAAPFQTAVYVERGSKEDLRPIDAQLSTSGTRIGMLSVWGAAGASVIFGAVATGLALAAENRALNVQQRVDAKQTVLQEGAAGPDGIFVDGADQHTAAHDERDAWRNAAIAGFGVGVGLAALGGALYVLDMPEVPLSVGPQRSIAKRSTRLVPTGSGLMLHGEF